VVLATDAVAAFEEGDILVAPQTDPSWTPLFVLAAAAVVDVGAANSHAMIVSRELGIPCAAGVTGATNRIPDGSLIEVDGTTGTVTVLEPVAG
jgi:pyruvate,water dikinase